MPPKIIIKQNIVFYWFSESRLPKVSVSRRRNVHLGKDVLLGVLRRRQGQSRKKALSKVACAFCVSVVIFNRNSTNIYFGRPSSCDFEGAASQINFQGVHDCV